MFANMKRSHSDNQSINAEDLIESTAKKQKKEEVKKEDKKMNFFQSWDNGGFSVVCEDDYKGEKTIALKYEAYNANVTTAAMTVKFSDVGPNGNLGTKFVPENAHSQAKFVMTLERGADSKVLSVMPTIETDQDAYFEWLKETAKKMMSMAWDEQIPMFASQYKKCKAAAKKEAKADSSINVDSRAKELFMEGASLPIKEHFDEDGDSVLVNKVARRYQYTDRKTGQTIINRPEFWKRNRDGGYDNVTEKVKFLNKGSVVITQISFRLYSMTSYYGVSTDLGKNIIIVWEKPSSANSKPKDSVPEVPYFD